MVAHQKWDLTRYLTMVSYTISYMKSYTSKVGSHTVSYTESYSSNVRSHTHTDFSFPVLFSVMPLCLQLLAKNENLAALWHQASACQIFIQASRNLQSCQGCRVLRIFTWIVLHFAICNVEIMRFVTFMHLYLFACRPTFGLRVKSTISLSSIHLSLRFSCQSNPPLSLLFCACTCMEGRGGAWSQIV